MATQPPYSNIAGIFTTDDKHQDITKVAYDGQARPGQLVIDTTDYQVYVSNADGMLNAVASSGNGTTGGSNTQIQFNDASDFGGSALLTFNKDTGITSITEALVNNLTLTGVFVGDLIPAANIAYDLGAPTQRWRDLWLSGTTIQLGPQTISANSSTVIFAGNIAATKYYGDGSAIVNIDATNIVGNISAATEANVANYAGIADVANLVAGANVTGTVGNANVALRAGTVTTAAQPNITSVGTLSSLSTAGNIDSAGEIIIANDNGHGGPGYAGIFTMTNANSGATNPNKFVRINNTGNLQIVNSAYTATIFDLNDAGKLTLRGGATLGDVANVSIAGGTNGQVLSTDGSGVLSWTDNGGGGGSTGDFVFNATTMSVTNAGDDINVLSGSGINMLAGTFAQLQWAADPANTTSSSNDVENNQFWIDQNGLHLVTYAAAAAGQIGEFTVQPDGNIYTTGGIATGNDIQSTGNIHTAANLSTGGEIIVDTQNEHGGPGYAGIMTMTNANTSATNPNKYLRLNITGDLQIIDSAYNETILNLSDTGVLTVRGADLGPVANLTIDGGTNGQVLATDGTGNLSWTTVSGAGVANRIENGTSSVAMPATDGNVEITADGTTWTFTDSGNLNIPATVYAPTSPVSIRGEYGFIVHPSHNTGGTGPELAISYNDGIEITPLTNDYLVSGTTAAPLYVQGAYTTAAGILPGSVYVSPGRNTTDSTYGNVVIGQNGGGIVKLLGDQIRLGAINKLSIDGGNPGDVLSTDGSSGLSWVAQSGGGANIGNLTVDDVTLQGVNQLNLSAGPDYTANLAYLQVRAGDVASHIHFDTGNSDAYDLIVGNDDKYVQVSSTGNIMMSSYDSGNTTSYGWTLDTTGNIVLPRGGIIGETNIPAVFTGNTIALTPSGGTNPNQQLLVYPTAGADNNHLHLTTGNIYDTELFLGNDDFYVMLANTGNIVVNANDNNGNISRWTFGTDNRLTFPGTPRIDTTDNNFEVQAAEAVNLEANTVVNIYTDSSGNAYQWQFGDDASITLPTVEVAAGLSEVSTVKSQRTIVPTGHWSAVITGTTPTVVYLASAPIIYSMKVTMMVQHGGSGCEMFDVLATQTGVDVYYSVTNRIKPPAISDTTVFVDRDVNGTLQITLTLTSGAPTAWVTYDATEFGLPND